MTFVSTVALLVAGCATQPASGPLGFFITSAGSGKGADLGGLAGADAHCQRLGTAAGSAIAGHHDRNGPLPEAWAKPWNFSHPSAGCSQEALVRTGGSGRFYCFTAN